MYSIGYVWPPAVRSNVVNSPPPVALIAGTSASSVVAASVALDVAASVALDVAASVWAYVVPIGTTNATEPSNIAIKVYIL
jgi:hypothetical protein